MIRTDRRLLISTLKLGLLLTVAVVVIQLLGWLDPLECRAYDWRVRHFQQFTPPPTDRLVHLDIDDPALETMGSWPWPREKLAMVVDELRLAGVKVFALDVLFPEQQVIRLKRQGDGDIVEVSDDLLFADSLNKVEVALIPAFFQPRQVNSKVYDAVLERLLEDLELTEPEVLILLREQGFSPDDLNPTIMRSRYLAARREAMHKRIVAIIESDNTATALDSLRSRLLPQTPTTLTGSPLLRLLAIEVNKIRSLQTLKTLAIKSAEDLSALNVDDRLTPILPIAQAAKATGHVNRMEDPDHVVRNIPLFVEYEGHLFPQLGLAAACAAMDIDTNDLQITKNSLTIKTNEGKVIELPLYERQIPGQSKRAQLFFDIPWFGGDDWQVMYGQPGNPSAGHVPILEVWKVRQFIDRIAKNNLNADRAILDIFDDEYEHQLRFDPALARKYKQQVSQTPDFAARKVLIEDMLKQLQPWVEQYQAWPDHEMTDTDRQQRRQLFAARDAITTILEQNEQLIDDLTSQRKHLRELFEDKTVLMGWTATSIAADFVLTPLHNSCPGPVVHGLVFNAVMTNHAWRRAGIAANLLATLAIGILASLIVAWISPTRAIAGVILLGSGWIALNGAALFDYGDTIVDMSYPLVCIVLIWLTATVLEFVAEQTERTRITKRFRSYVDPMLVNYVIDHRDQARLDGKVDELTVVFTDLEGFTTISEKLREKSVGLLNQYMQMMVPVIREHGGYVNKFLGDGIMFFYGAPQHNANHARDAVMTALKMQELMQQFNGRMIEQGLPQLRMRIGIASGEMVVGDAGPDDASDYTVLGDTVNLAARLESANKATGTDILINQRTAELLGDTFMLLPISKLKVKGKNEAVMVWWPRGLAGTVDDVLKEQAKYLDSTIKQFAGGEFEQCLALLDQIERDIPVIRPLVELYREQCESYLAGQPMDGFDGAIELASK